MLTVADFLRQLSRDDELALGNAIGSGLHDARLAAQCITEPGRHAENVLQLGAYLTRAIESLEAARAIVRKEG
jgi:hypothetical protein